MSRQVSVTHREAGSPTSPGVVRAPTGILISLNEELFKAWSEKGFLGRLRCERAEVHKKEWVWNALFLED